MLDWKPVLIHGKEQVSVYKFAIQGSKKFFGGL